MGYGGGGSGNAVREPEGKEGGEDDPSLGGTYRYSIYIQGILRGKRWSGGGCNR